MSPHRDIRTPRRPAASNSSRQPYEPPALRTISLVAEEVLSVGCKLGAGPGPFGATCDAVPCNQPGS
ncbi:MAG: hypothetical protein AAF772_00825 [Acidobacteriota bacterium]